MFYERRVGAMENEKLSIRVMFLHLLLRITHLVRKQDFTTKTNNGKINVMCRRA